MFCDLSNGSSLTHEKAAVKGNNKSLKSQKRRKGSAMTRRGEYAAVTCMNSALRIGGCNNCDVSALLIGRKKPSSLSSNKTKSSSASASPAENSDSFNAPLECEGKTANDVQQVKDQVKLPAAMEKLKEKYSFKPVMRKFERSVSIKVSRTLSSVKNQYEKKKWKYKSDEDNSLWTKTIILGEKCRPDEEDDIMIYDKKGNIFSTYHKRIDQNKINHSLSATNSFINLT